MGLGRPPHLRNKTMSWPTISASDLNDYKFGAQISALRTAALADGQADPFANVMQDRCTYIRARISRFNLETTAYSVPPELKTCAVWLIIEAMQTRLTGLLLNDDDRRMIQRAYDDLNLAASGEMPVTTPTTATTPSVQTASPSMEEKTLDYDSTDQDGL